MKVVETFIPDLLVLEPRVFLDDRGYFLESFNQKVMIENGIDISFRQDNHSKSTFGVLRGLHYQKAPYAQTKLVRVTRGEVYDVAVDLRRGSPTYKQSFGLILSEDNFKQLLIPQGFAHGFVVLSETAEFLYKCDNYYNKASEGGILYNDTDLNIDWHIDKEHIILSQKDKLNPTFDKADFDFPFEEFSNDRK